MKDVRIARNPAAGIKLPRLPKVERRFLTRDQCSIWQMQPHGIPSPKSANSTGS